MDKKFMKLKMHTWSHSRLATFEQCKLKFKYKYIDKLEADMEGSIETFLGSRVHETLEKLYRDIHFGKKVSLEELLDFYNRQWKKNWSDNIRIVRTDYSAEDHRRRGVQFIKDYFNRHYPFDDSKILGLEQKVVLDLDEKGKYKLQGFIDRLALKGDTIEIHDYKTNAHLPYQKYLDQDRQLALYALAVKNNYPFAKKIKLVWHFLAFDKDIVSERSDEELEALKKETLDLIKHIESTENFEPTENSLCYWCEFANICPKKKHEFEAEKLPTKEFKREDGVRLVNKYSRLKQKEKEIKKELEKTKNELVDYADKNNLDNVSGSDMIARVRKYINYKLPQKGSDEQKELINLIKELGKWDEFSTLDSFHLAKSLQRGDVDEKTFEKLKDFVEKYERIMVYLGKKKRF